jgi:UDP-glucose 4-epimerase
MKKVFITGVAGFIGSEIAKRFIAEGWIVYGIDNLLTGLVESIPAGVKFIKGDVIDINKIKELKYIKFDIVLHLAGQSSGEISYENPRNDLLLNTVSTIELIKYSISNKIPRIVFASSMSVYGNISGSGEAREDHRPNPLSCYGVSKFSAENYLRIFKPQLKSLSMRMFNVYGPNQNLLNLKQGMVSIYISQAITNSSILVKGSLDRYRDFIYIDDVVDFWWKSATLFWPEDVESINIGTGKKTFVRDLVSLIGKHVPVSNVVQIDSTMGDQFGIFANINLLERCFGSYHFIEINDGLIKFIDWAKSNQS